MILPRRIRPVAGVCVSFTLVFLGALFWASGNDPFDRYWFQAVPSDVSPVDCVAMVSKPAHGSRPVIIYFHGSGSSLPASGRSLRQIAEMGFTTVGMAYCLTNQAIFNAQFTALLDSLGHQSWAGKNQIAWIGHSLGAQRMLSYLLAHPERPPALLVQLGGGIVPEMFVENTNRYSNLKVLLVHGERDEVFPLTQMNDTASFLSTRGAIVQTWILDGMGHSLQEKRLLVFRRIAERCLILLKGKDALRDYHSASRWCASASPLWPFLIPVVAWTVFWFFLEKVRRPILEHHSTSKWPAISVFAWGLAGILVFAVLAQASLWFILPTLPANDRSLAVARRVLVQRSELKDFDWLSTQSAWHENTVGSILEHAHLSNYSRRLVSWQVSDQIYRDYVLNPFVDPELDRSMDWRRMLWETFYPRVRKELSVDNAAQIVITHLSERVAISGKEDLSPSIHDSWQRQVTNQRGFLGLYVAALRSCGIPARLNASGESEIWVKHSWRLAPLPSL